MNWPKHIGIDCAFQLALRLRIHAILISLMLSTTFAFSQRSALVGASQEFSNTSALVRTARLDDSHFIVFYKNGSTSSSSDLFARVGEVDTSSQTIAWGNAKLIEADLNLRSTVTALSSDQVVIAYEREVSSNDTGIARILSIDTAADTISVGQAFAFHDESIDAAFSHTPISMVKLTDTSFAMCFADGSTDNGKVVIGNVSNDSISFGSEQEWSSGDVHNFWIDTLSPDKIVISYEDDGSSADQGKAIIGDISGSTVSYGSPSAFYNNSSSSSVSYTAVKSISDTQFVVAYTRDALNEGNAIVGTVSGTSITYGASYVMNSESSSAGPRDITICNAYGANAGDREVAISFNTGASDSAFIVIAKATGTVLSFSDTAFFVNEADDSWLTNLNNNTLVVSYVNDQSSDKGESKVIKLTPQSASTFNATIRAKAHDCDTTSSGYIIAKAGGGIATYTYVWSTGDTISNSPDSTNTITGLSAGTYTVTITDGNSNVDSVTTIILNKTLSATLVAGIDTSTYNGAHVTCAGDSNGWISATPSGGTGGYRFVWSNGNLTDSIANLSADTYALTLTNATGCLIDSIAILDPAAVSASLVATNISCNGQVDGIMDASASTGGTVSVDYTYVWSNALDSISMHDSLAADTYSITISDDNGCLDSMSAYIEEPDSISASISLDSLISCNGYSDGELSASVNGGTMPYYYSWSNSDTTAFADSLVAGTYFVTVVDTFGCSDSAWMSIGEPTAVVVTTVLDSNAICYNSSDGGVSASATGGASGYTYSWSNQVSTASNSGIPQGTYTVYVTDSTGCFGTESIVVQAVDTIPPVAVSQNAVVHLDSHGIAIISYLDVNNGSTDNCIIDSMYTDIDTMTCSNIGTALVTLIVVDGDGNVDSSTSLVTVIDSLGPFFDECLTDTIVAASDSCGYIIPDYTASMFIWDSCGLASVVQSPTPGTNIGSGVSQISIVATDGYGNSSTCSFNVTVNDSTPPIISCHPDTVISNDSSECGAIFDYSMPTATDNCGIDSLVQISGLSSGSMFPIGVTVVRFVAYDSAANTDTCTFSITVNDNELPLITCMGDTTLCQDTFSYPIPTYSDNCGIQSIVQSTGLPSGSSFPVGSTVNTFVVTDSAGNKDSCSFTVNRDALPSIAQTQLDTTLCDTTLGVIMATTPAIGVGIWASSGAATVETPNLNTSSVAGLELGTNQFIWTVSNGVCPESIDTLTLAVDDSPTVAEVGADIAICDTTVHSIKANLPSVGIGVWSTTTQAIIADSLNEKTTVSNLPLGMSTITWTISNGVCPSSADDVVIDAGTTPIVDAGEDVHTQGVVEYLPVSVYVNQQAEISWEPASLLVDPFAYSTGAYIENTTEFTVTAVSSAGCFATDTLLVTILKPMQINTAFTPNGDGINEVWDIEGSEYYPNLVVRIFNRWGNLVFESSEGYNEPFDGKFNGELLPVSSYYYILEFNDGITKPRDGNLTIVY